MIRPLRRVHRCAVWLLALLLPLLLAAAAAWRVPVPVQVHWPLDAPP